MKKPVFIIIEGLMEHEGRSRRDLWGTGEGETLEEVCRDIIKKLPDKGKTFSCEASDRCYDWGFTLEFSRRLKG